MGCDSIICVAAAAAEPVSSGVCAVGGWVDLILLQMHAHECATTSWARLNQCYVSRKSCGNGVEEYCC